MTYSKDWEKIVGRFGRWIDFENDYKTMDTRYMESVWWTFKQIHDQGLVYRGARIMPFSTTCNTVLSNFEAGSNYQDTQDPSVFITFPLEDEPETSLMAWTTTPWTLPSNLACAVNPDLEYLKIKDEERGKVYVVAAARLAEVLKQNKIKKHKVVSKLKGADLVGKKYTPLYKYFAAWGEAPRNCFRVIAGTFVTTDAGTGVVHCAPGFGEEDYKACLAGGLVTPGEIVMPVDDDGKFKDVVADFKGLYIKDADALIIKDLKDRQRLVASGTIRHSYPFCWRSQTPLIYRAVSTWFIRVTDVKEALVKNNEDPRWVPDWV
jgi:isoleucyl-tRNA synthetase